MYIIKLVMLVGLILGFAGCSSRSVVPTSTQQIDVNKYKTSSQNGVLYLIRHEDFREGAVASTFYIDTHKIGTIGNESAYFIVELEPGTYTYKRVKEDMFGTGEPIKRRVRVRAGFERMFIVEGGFGFDAVLDKSSIKNHKFLGYKKISK